MEGGMTLATIISDMTTFITGLIEWFTDLVGFVASTPMLLVFLYITLAGVVIKFLRRWLPGGV